MRSGEIPNFTGITSPYEAPKHPEIEINTVDMNAEDHFLQNCGFLLNYVLENHKLSLQYSHFSVNLLREATDYIFDKIKGYLE